MATNNSFMTDGFDFQTLTDAANSTPTATGVVTDAKLFMVEQITSTEVNIQSVNETLSLIPASPRGGVVRPHTPAGRSLTNVKTAHLRLNHTMLADTWQGRSSFVNKGTPASVLSERDRVIGEMKRRGAATIDYMQSRAVQGQIIDADGSILVDLHAELGITPASVDCALDVSTTHVANKIVAAKRLAESALGMAYASGWVAFASPEFMDALRAHASVEAAVAGWQAATIMTADHRFGDLVIGGVRFVEVANRAGKTYIDANTAVLCAEGVPDLFKVAFAPADYIECVNQPGQPFYAKAIELEFNRGIEIEVQSNPLPYCTRPASVIRLTA